MSIPPVEFLIDSSQAAIQDLELNSLNRSANLAKIIKVELDAWVEELAAAFVARWMLENRDALLHERSFAPAAKPFQIKLFDMPDKKKSA